ncbi:hypothetical protein EJ05DRAFT_495886 [Pseudovirgaria hyperparasitica]|uniref:Aflatoxin regulatory protein domain-containing protein n=1 Tax=Pseudovirgaria hyperparasitica TaxID=470096 RepID=A0A6A6WLG1_9PEZI|nr:uncharacterized protein EJ05DRAFT_495886 [Pseudovirgaria hyperparasitica]KAF2763045.1 hypothetical protein EJ05DRAFT_495886 [Pseudovirgaria hyperparasitica]
MVVRQRNKRSKGEDVPSPKANTQLKQDLPTVLSIPDVAGYDINDLMMPLPPLDMDIVCIDDGDTYSWNNGPGLTYNGDDDSMTQESSGTGPTLSQDESKDTLTEQLMKLSQRATRATRELECGEIVLPLTVNSPVVNEAFETANALVRIINSMPLTDSTYESSLLSRDSSQQQLPTFLALAAYQYVLGLFRAICGSIKCSSGSIAQGIELQQQTLHGAGSCSAQFIMVLQLIMHLLNRIGRSLRTGSRRNSDQHELGGGEVGSLQGVVDSAQVMLRSMTDEHVKLGGVIQDLQAGIEEGVHM